MQEIVRSVLMWCSISRGRLIFTIGLSAILTVSLYGCGLFASIFVESHSPDGKVAVEVWETINGPDSSIEIALLKTGSRKKIYSDLSDRWPSVSEVYWDESSKTVRVLVCDKLVPEILVGYDYATDQKLPTDRVKRGIAENLKRRYAPSEIALKRYEGDVIGWACSDDGPVKPFLAMLAKSRVLSP